MQQFPEEQIHRWLYDLRTGKIPPDFLHSDASPASHGSAAESLVAGLAWLKAGDKARAMSAYQAGTRESRLNGNSNWVGEVYYESLRRELEALLAAEASPESEEPPRATAVPASASDSPTASEPLQIGPIRPSQIAPPRPSARFFLTLRVMPVGQFRLEVLGGGVDADSAPSNGDLPSHLLGVKDSISIRRCFMRRYFNLAFTFTIILASLALTVGATKADSSSSPTHWPQSRATRPANS